MNTLSYCILKDVKTYEIMYDLIQQEGEPVLNIPVTFPEGKDWEVLTTMARDLDIKDISIRVKPMQNMVIANAEPTPGYVSGDFCTYLVAYPGCTFNDKEGMTISTAAISGGYCSGTRTTAINASIDPNVWCTYTPADGSLPAKKKVQGFIDVDALKSPANFYQAGKLVVGIKPEEFKIANTTTTAGAVKRQIADKVKRYGKEEPVEQGKKKSRRNSNPTIKTDEYPDEPIEIDGKKHLYVKWDFQLEITTKVAYHVKTPEN